MIFNFPALLWQSVTVYVSNGNLNEAIICFSLDICLTHWFIKRDEYKHHELDAFLTVIM